MSTAVAEKQHILPYQAAIKGAKERFLKIKDEKTFDVESIFAMQSITKNDFSLKIATNNPGSVKLAMINVASTGLTLNPAHAYAYLVPRDGAIMLDISYKGLIKIATDTGSVVWARADLVYEADKFDYRGPAEKPDHVANAFTDRGKLVGAYCIAKTKDGDVLTEIMDVAEIEKIRDKSMAYAKKKSGPWVEWFEQMVKKSVIKRASKTWPYSQTTEKLMDAIEMANAAEGGYDFEGESTTKILPTDGVWEMIKEDEAEQIRKIAERANKRFAAYDVSGAVEIIDEGKQHDAHFQAALWSLFESKQRTAATKYKKALANPDEPIEQDMDKEAMTAMEMDKD